MTHFFLVLCLSVLLSGLINGRPGYIIGIYLLMLALAIELDQKPLKTYITRQLYYRREAAQRRHQYELFKAGVKSGLYATDEQVADENRRVIQ